MVARLLTTHLNPTKQKSTKEITMAASWLKKYLTMKPEINQIYDDLDAYREFCVKQGYNFDERHLYHEKTPWGEWQRVLNGKRPKDNWYYVRHNNNHRNKR